MTLPDLLRHRARRHPGAPAFSVGGRTVHFGQWYDLARSWHDALSGRGLRPDERVVLEFRDEDWSSFAAAFIAVLAAGGVAVPLRHPLPAGRRDELVGLVDAAGCLTGPGIPPSGVTRWGVSADELAHPHTGAAWRGAPVRPPGAPASIMFTSGTTGTPRAIVCPRADLEPGLRTRLQVARPRRRALLTSAAVGTVAAQTVIASCLVNGVHIVVENPFDAEGVADRVEAHRVTAISLVPATARLMVQALERSGRTLPSVRSMVCSSAPLDRPTVEGLARVLPAALITNVYSLTEGGPGLTSTCRPGREPSVGRLGRDVRLVDRDGNDVGPGGTGELWLRGRRVGRAYLAVPDGDAPGGPEAGTRIVAGGWIATGDVCRRDADGTLYFVDRGDDVIVSGGLNIASAVVEAAVRTLPGVRDVAVFGVPHPVLGRVAVAAVVLDDGVGAGDVRMHCLDTLPPEQVPRDVTEVDELPMTPSGKVRKKELARRYTDTQPAPAGAAADDRTEEVVLTALRSALDAPAIDAASNFYLIGGHSLQAARIAAELSDRLQVDVPAGWLLQYPVVRDFATQVTRLRRG